MPARSTSARPLAIRLYCPLVRRRFARSRIRSMARWLALIVITQQISCAGGGGGGTPINNTVDLTPSVRITLSPASTQIAAGTSVQFLVTVQNASNPAVTWQVNGTPGGSPSVGTITPSGVATASYAAPASVSSLLMVTVAAVLQADSTKTGLAMVTINPLPAPRITIAPVNPTVVTGGSQQFTASVQNGPQVVIWEVNGIPGGSAMSGTIMPSSSGSLIAFYTAPASIPNSNMVTITATLQTDLSVFGSTNVTIAAPPITLSISPVTANVPGGQTLQFSAEVQNSNAPVIWQVNGVNGGNGADGMITPSGTYTATYSAPTVSSSLTVNVTAVLQTGAPLSASAAVTIVPVNTFTGVYSWRNDNGLTGQNPQETMLTPSSVSSTTGPTFRKLFGCTVDGPAGSQIYAQPLYVANVSIPNMGTHNVVYVATEHDSIYAFDADANPCQTLWQVRFINPAMNVTTVPATDIPGQTDIAPEIGITGTPVIDSSTATLYVVAKTKTIASGSPVYSQDLHALDLTTGAEKFGGPAAIRATVNAGTLTFDSMNLTENQRSALLLAGGNVYVAFDSYSDTDPFHGWLFAYHAADLQTAPAVFITTPNGSHGGIGESGAALSADSSGNIFAVTSDGTFDANTGGNDYAETLLKLRSDTAAFSVADSFTPWNQAILNLPQKHFGSTGVLLLPDSLGSSTHPNLALAGNELGNLYVVDRNNLGAFSSTPGVDNIVQTLPLSGPNFGTPAYWAANNTVYVAAAGDNLRALPLSSGMLSSPLCSQPSICSADTLPFFGASPVISSNGSTAGIVWALDTSGYVTSSPAVLHAYDATNLANELYVSPSSTGGAALPAGPAVKFAVPTVANGKVYIGTQNELSVFGLQ